MHFADIAIVGAGLSGSLVATQLLLQAEAPLRIALIERGRPFGRGLAYSTRSGAHFLNVPAGKMSALPGDMGHFLRWLRERQPEAAAHDFVPRHLYGDYLAWLLGDAEERSVARLLRMEAEVLGLDRDEAGLVLRLRGGEALHAAQVVLAMGNLDPQDPRCASPDLLRSRRYVRDPWSMQAVDHLDPAAPVLLIGTGLTAVDVALSLRDAGHYGPVHALSRHGLLPATHAPTSPWTLRRDLLRLEPTARNLLRALRAETRDAERAGADWRAVIDAVRPLTTQLWLRLPRDEKRRFLRHARAHWEVRRHRMAPEVAAAVEGMRALGQLRIRAARLLSLDENAGGVAVQLRPRGSKRVERLQVDRVLNCTGPNANLRREHDPLIVQLLASGSIRPDPLGLGLSTSADGAVLDTAGHPAHDLFAIGPMRRGDLWETTAAPEIRAQAEVLARHLRAARSASHAATPWQ